MILPLSKKTDPAVPSSDPKLLWVKKGETEFFTEDHAVCVSFPGKKQTTQIIKRVCLKMEDTPK